ncbi:hypothetical protein DYB32_001450 [Aphanomyces invadans]|uniref:EF-hand domain-containing protein n=1 Tax=Aphanomyces invadans TaxID=157072 RepID=A0A418B6G9_9STRA|nr:hypothetical protein DYB32_001450 [Aphanomyces invadans]
MFWIFLQGAMQQLSFSRSAPADAAQWREPQNKPQPPSSPLVRSANQEDKDDHVAFPSFPPPPNFQQLPARDPPGFNVHLVESTFRVIDIKRRGKLNVREIHQGLQLLGIATTLRQSSLYPLVQQAEETLRAIQDRHAGNLSVLLSPKDLEIVADHVDDFGDLLLDEVLLLTTTEQLKALHATQASHDEDVQQLITMIDDIQASEQAMAEALLRPLTTIQDDGDARVATTPYLVPICTLPQLSEPQAQCENVASRPALAIFTDEAQLCRRLTVCTNNIATIEDTLEDHRKAFLRSRRIAEASLADTGIEQPAVIEL